MNFMYQDWQHRPTHRRVWALAAPMILSNISVPLVALVDSAVIGHLPHAHQLGAVAVGASLFNLLAWAFGFLRMGATGFTAQAAGRGDGTALRQILAQGLALALAFSLLLGALAVPLASWALLWMNPSAALEQSALAFLYIRLMALPATLGGYALTGWFLGTGNARAPLWIMLSTNGLNIVLNLYLVLGLGWGVQGSAWASVVAEWAALVLGLALARPALRAWPGQLAWAPLRRWASWRPLLAVNRDIFLRSLALQGVFFLITVQGARLGDATVAANALLLNGLVLTAQALDGLAHAVEALCGHAIGARDRTGLRRALVVSAGWSLLASIAFALFFLVAGGPFITLQTDIPSVREAAGAYLPYLALLPLVAVWSYLLDGLFIGATRAREMRNTMLASVALAAPVALATMGLGNHGLWISFLWFMALRGITLGWVAWRLDVHKRWV
ncbi:MULTISPECIES: MATE family efflux transporter [unclassified Pseudomonas]|uniref:MATE family efflux transporter n=1 Tax=unclassified Pseudomonas TaxID=196821 RepID=UPI000BC3EE30|nr:MULTISPECIES: MATE family efflux transporter [unclassified Pseudomonas]PVZ09783.1 MATE family multidrug resistance protein [Pseudomonas sp. URIL14HWK12:I12]PVZ21461.1 MATE family multidrug resistance protein [Pseudomonas sp. URIL14HWK12:I10]PVZ30358.1 MATE family multidrug resistance protein [Pseudomonas sp. URIL14HWK12:I11]SNZ18655.1 multidrug resistance protein, MATE family [Pseudomonas sp. URIL14HWK12:I9]